jgi:hypothetical protein
VLGDFFKVDEKTIQIYFQLFTIQPRWTITKPT